MTTAGIDVAWPQGRHYNWRQHAGRIQFAMCKATEGTGLIDPTLADNWNGMWMLNRTMPRFGYHFFHPAQDPVRQADFFVATVRKHGLLAGDNLVGDFETTDGLPPHVVAERSVAFLHRVNAIAPEHRILPYTYVAFARAGNCAGMGGWHLWLAEYGVSRPSVPAPWQEWTLWQNGDRGVDTDVFNGGEEQLLEFCRMPAKR